MMMEDDADGLAHLFIAALALCGGSSMVVTAAWHLEAIADAPHAVACALGNEVDHFAELDWSLVRRIMAAFFKP